MILLSSGLEGNLRGGSGGGRDEEKCGEPGSGRSMGDAAGERDFERRTGVMDALFIHFGFDDLFDFDNSLDERGESSDVMDGEGEGVLSL